MKPEKPQQFHLKPGQTDYTHIRWAPVLNCVVRYRGRILILQRTGKVRFYRGYWNGVSGFLDDGRSLAQKTRDELKEEVGLLSKDIIRIRFGPIFDKEATRYKKTWIVHTVLADVKTDKITLDWEAKSARWIKPAQVHTFKLMPGFQEVLEGLDVIKRT